MEEWLAEIEVFDDRPLIAVLFSARRLHTARETAAML
jgi:hypothetical protein